MIRVSVLGKAYQDMSIPPDYTPLWIVLVLLAVVGAGVCAYFFYRKTHYHPVYFAGRVRYARHGSTIYDACLLDALGNSWLDKRVQDLSSQDKITGLYLDAALTVPLDKQQMVTAPIRIYPKIIK